ncbi:MAG: hypothetical protein E6713_15330 [Sporomusaceae bacterium]|nr:hypothetical protein [Sporomusaceae bacterium]
MALQPEQQLTQMLQLQQLYVNKISKMIMEVWFPLFLTENKTFLGFWQAFIVFMQFQAGSEGYSRAIFIFPEPHSSGLETLLDTFVVTGAEYLELAIAYLEEAQALPSAWNKELSGIHQFLLLIEEMELNIIALLEILLAQKKQGELLQ